MKRAIRLDKSKLLIAVLSIVCIILGTMQITNYLDAKQDEYLYMKKVYSNLRSVQSMTGDLCEGNYVQGDLDTHLLELRFGLRTIGKQLEDGYQFVAECIPSASSFWFYESSAAIEDPNHPFISEEGTLTSLGLSYLTRLHNNIGELLEQMVGADQMNLSTDITIEAFSSIIQTFYDTAN